MSKLDVNIYVIDIRIGEMRPIHTDIQIKEFLKTNAG